MDAEQRLADAVIRGAYEQALAEGHGTFFDEQMNGVAEQVGATAQQLRQVQRQIVEAYLFERPSRGFYRATPRLFEEYEKIDRAAAYRQNEIRRWILEQVGRIDAEAKSTGIIQFHPDEDDPYPPAEQYVAAKVLAYEGCVEMPDEGRSTSFRVKLGSRGYEALRDEKLMRRMFPVSVTDDAEAQISIAPDVLQSVITSCEQLLEELGWKQALIELARGDKEYRDDDWVNAVREYYAATESGLKYALGLEEELDEDDRRALQRLAGEAGRTGVIPVNYAALYGFADSIRSPRSHGGGRRAEKIGEVEVGKAEAMLMGNHARMLLVYLGQRASAARGPDDRAS